jgi:hypothetical protein
MAATLDNALEFGTGLSRIRLNPSRPQLVWHVTTTAIDIPREYRRYRVPELSHGPRTMWTRNRRAAYALCAVDEAAGGEPWPFPYAFRRCGYCGRPILGLPAQMQRDEEARAWLSGRAVDPCSWVCSGLKHLENPKSLGKSMQFSASLTGCRASAHGGRGTVEQHESLDVRMLRRAGALTRGARFEHGGIRGRNTGTGLVVSWNTRVRGQTVRLLRTQCNYGGTRSWLECPVSGCGGRVGVLYANGSRLACRRCLELRYSSQKEDLGGRRLRSARKIVARLRMPEGLVFAPRAKPKRMHRGTYDELRCRYTTLLREGLGLLDEGE